MILPNSPKIIAALTSGRVSIFDASTNLQSTSEILTDGTILNVTFNEHLNKALNSDNYGNLILFDVEKFICDKSWLAHTSKYGIVNLFIYNRL